MTGLPRHEMDRLMVAAGGPTPAQRASGVDVDRSVQERLHSLVQRRVAGVPLQHLEGTVPFGPIEVAVDDRALVPRPETELMWEMAAEALGEAGPGTNIVDLGTGSGVLALALKHRFPRAAVHAVDIDAAALSLAAENAEALELDIALHHGDLFEALPDSLRGRIDLMVANPPYVATDDLDGLPVEVREHDPRIALDGGPDGLDIIRRIADEAPWWLAIEGWAFVEIGIEQAAEALALFGGLDREVRDDLSGRPRYLVARRGAPCCR